MDSLLIIRMRFLANGLGAHYDSQLQDLIVVSMGTGTSFCEKWKEVENISHIGGIGIGGGTIQGLSCLLLKHRIFIKW